MKHLLGKVIVIITYVNNQTHSLSWWKFCPYSWNTIDKFVLNSCLILMDFNFHQLKSLTFYTKLFISIITCLNFDLLMSSLCLHFYIASISIFLIGFVSININSAWSGMLISVNVNFDISIVLNLTCQNIIFCKYTSTQFKHWLGDLRSLFVYNFITIELIMCFY